MISPKPLPPHYQEVIEEFLLLFQLIQLHSNPIIYPQSIDYMKILSIMDHLNGRLQDSIQKQQKIWFLLKLEDEELKICYKIFNMKCRHNLYVLFYISQNKGIGVFLLFGVLLLMFLLKGQSEKVENVIAKTEQKLEIQKKEEMVQENTKKIQINEDIKKKTSIYIKVLNIIVDEQNRLYKELRDQNQKKNKIIN
ncbi:unnamed protein product [Paramecium sonneborni]|uniref:Transmembrane protein n=1 Tax=Paramecium sonneborni TaxID=65129 RepID=A0A8S1P4B2_9CILI|nr:unnamed protein product [Paramecium sonneborni]